MTVQSSKTTYQKILRHGSEYNFEKVQFWTKFDILTPMGPGQEFSQRQHIHSQKCLISV